MQQKKLRESDFDQDSAEVAGMTRFKRPKYTEGYGSAYFKRIEGIRKRKDKLRKLMRPKSAD